MKSLYEFKCPECESTRCRMMTREKFVAEDVRCLKCGALMERFIDNRDGFEIPGGMAKKGWPKTSMAMGCHPSQVDRFQEFLAKKGVPTRFNRHGQPILESHGHMKRVMKARGMVDFDGYG